MKGEKEAISDTEKQCVTQCWLEEYKSLRGEIDQRQVSIRYLVILNLTILGTILTLVFSNVRENILLLMVIPALAGILGFMTYVHSHKISELGHYIRDRIKPKLVELTNEVKILDWEQYTREVETRRNVFFRWISTEGISMLTFILPGILSLVFVAGEAFSHEIGWQAFWAIDMLLILFLIISIIADRKYWYAGKKGD